MSQQIQCMSQPKIYWLQKSAVFLKIDPFYIRKIPLFVLPVMPDVLDIVIVLQHINELLHILQVALIGEGDVVLGLLPQGFQRFFDCCFQPNKLLPVTR